MIKNYIWDFDGTLYNSYPHITEAFLAALGRFGIVCDRGEAFAALSISIDYACEKYGVTSEQKELFRELNNDCDFTPLIVPFEGAAEILERVIKSGGVNYIFTHRRADSLEYYLKKYGFDGFFRECVTADNGFENKPSPAGVLYLAEKYSLNKGETVMIGDREIDVLSGINAGTKACLIAGEEKRKESSATFFANTAAELGNVFGI